jgi:hypothetical protein
MIEIVKMLLGMAIEDTSKDALLNHYINLALRLVLSYCNINAIASDYDGTIAELAVFLYKNKDNLGYSQKTEGERSITLIGSDIPEYIKEALPKPKIVIGGV